MWDMYSLVFFGIKIILLFLFENDIVGLVLVV